MEHEMTVLLCYALTAVVLVFNAVAAVLNFRAARQALQASRKS